MKKNTVIKAVAILIAIFLVLNIGWFSITTIKYNKYLKDIPKNKWGLYFIEKEDGYMYSVKKPSYPTFTGNLGVVNNKEGEALIIWPLMSGGYQYGVRLEKDGGGYQIYVNEKMEAVNKDDSYDVEIVNKYRTEIEELFSKANEIWDLSQ